MRISFDIIKQTLQFIKDSSNVSEQNVIDYLKSLDFDNDRAIYWVSTFKKTINIYQNKENTIDNAKEWINSQAADVNKLTDMLIGMLSAFWDNEENVTITKGDKVYKTIISQEIRLKELEQRHRHLQRVISELQKPSEQELLEWARFNHPFFLELPRLQADLQHIEHEINSIRDANGN